MITKFTMKWREPIMLLNLEWEWKSLSIPPDFLNSTAVSQKVRYHLRYTLNTNVRKFTNEAAFTETCKGKII
jgi:hypothetical protein